MFSQLFLCLQNNPRFGFLTGSITYILGISVESYQNQITWILQNIAFIVTIIVGLFTLYSQHRKLKNGKKQL